MNIETTSIYKETITSGLYNHYDYITKVNLHNNDTTIYS